MNIEKEYTKHLEDIESNRSLLVTLLFLFILGVLTFFLKFFGSSFGIPEEIIYYMMKKIPFISFSYNEFHEIVNDTNSPYSINIYLSIYWGSFVAGVFVLINTMRIIYFKKILIEKKNITYQSRELIKHLKVTLLKKNLTIR